MMRIKNIILIPTFLVFLYGTSLLILQSLVQKQSKQRPIERLLPTVGTGHPTREYIEHTYVDVEYFKVLDTELNHFVLPSTPATMNAAEIISGIVKIWERRVVDFRKYLFKNGVNNFDPLLTFENAPFRNVQKLLRKKFKGTPEMQNFTTEMDLPESVWTDLNMVRYSRCLEYADECGVQNVPVVAKNVSLVIPVTAYQYKKSWVTFESLRQLIVFPKAIVVIVTGVRSEERKNSYEELELSAFLHIINDTYSKMLPPGCSMKVFVSDPLYQPGENRWFGFNQTSTPIVSLFDGDDYMHPQMIMALDSMFESRPELDYALINYEAGTAEGPFRGDIYYTHILKFLTQRQFTNLDIERVSSYSSNVYEKNMFDLPKWNKTWYLGNTDAEPNWSNEKQKWWDYGCHNGWTTMRRHVMEQIPPPTRKYGGEDAIFNYRVARAGFNYRCFPMVLACYMKCFCDGPFNLWS